MSKHPAHLLIAGATGHGKVVAEAAQISGRWQRIAFIDDAYPDLKEVLGFPVLASYAEAATLLQEFPFAVVTLGNHQQRTRLQDRLGLMGYHMARIVHPAAIISPSATIGAGTVVLAGTIINANASIGRSCIINAGAVIEHDTMIDDSVQIGANATISAHAKIGTGCSIGAGAIIKTQVTLGKNCQVAAGALVLNNLPDANRVVANPTQTQTQIQTEGVSE